MAHHDEAGDQPSKTLSGYVERIDGNLMWRQEWRRVTRDEFQALGTLEQTGKRVVETITAWLAHAFDSLPPSKQSELHVDFERPEWVDIEIPAHALHELQRLAASMQGYVTKAHWKSEGWTDDQWRALGVLQSIRSAVVTTHGLEARQALPLMDAMLNVGVAVSKAHTVPWEPVAKYGLEAKEARKAGPAAKKLLKGASKKAFRDAWSDWVRAGCPGKKYQFDQRMAERFHISAKVAEKERLALQDSLAPSSEGETL